MAQQQPSCTAALAKPRTHPPTRPPPQLAWTKWLNNAENFFLSLRTAGVAGKRHLLAAEEDPAAAQYRALLLNQMQVGVRRGSMRNPAVDEPWGTNCCGAVLRYGEGSG